MPSILPTEALTLSRIPAPDGDSGAIIAFAQSLNGYTAVGGEAANLGRYIKPLQDQPLDAVSLEDLRILLFARQRSHYYSGGGWPSGDPIMDEMRVLVNAIRGRVEAQGQGISIWRGDITVLDVDAIVNAANEALLGGGGVDGAIHTAAGPNLREACEALPEVSPGVRCPAGQARITKGFRLDADYVIHTVGPRWQGGGHGEAETLRAAYHASLALAAEQGLESIAFPSISTGVFGFPVPSGAEIAVTTCQAFLAQHALPLRVLLVAFDAETEGALRRALGESEDSGPGR